MIISSHYYSDMDDDLHIRELINRLARLDAASAWDGDLNPTQRAVLVYLARANRFSKSPSHVAEYLGTTRGTISQSFKSLAKKGYVTERRSTQDKRVISFDLTPSGEAEARAGGRLEQCLSSLDHPQKRALATALTGVLRAVLAQNHGRAFGMCQNCVHFESAENGGYCRLLSEPLLAAEITQICHEQVSA